MSGTICFGGVCIPINAIWPVIVLGLKWLFEKLTGAPPTIDVALDERPVEQLPTSTLRQQRRGLGRARRED